MVNGYAPLTLAQALEIRSEHEVIPYAGGTDLMVIDPKDPTYLFLNKIEELQKISDDGEYIRIGACVTFTQAIADGLVPDIMKEAASRIAAPAIRNAGTFGGNAANGSDKADSVLVEYALDGRLRLVSLSGERIVNIEDFCIARRQRDLRCDELIAEILLPKKNIGSYYYKKVGGRNALAISHIALAGAYHVHAGVLERFSAAVIADAGTVLRFRDLEAMLTGKAIDEVSALRGEFLERFGERIVLGRGRVSAGYRKTVSLNLLGDYIDSITSGAEISK